jgi:flagellar biogenesis protein FliO
VRRFSARDGAANFAACSALGILLAARFALAAGVTQVTVGPQAAPATQQTAVDPPSSPPKSKYESIEFANRPPQQRGGTPTQLLTSDSGVPRVLGALGVVIGCIFIVRYLGKKILGLQTIGSGGGVVQILSRTPISPRQQLMLIQVGRRIVLVANCGAAMNALCEITDADEVASLAGQLQQRRRTSATSAFLSIFGKAGASFEAQQEQEPIPTPQMAPDEEEVTTEDPVEPELATTRQEMRGLMDRVHQLAQHYRKTTS